MVIKLKHSFELGALEVLLIAALLGFVGFLMLSPIWFSP